MLNFIVSFLQTDIRICVPFLLAALGLTFSARAGVVNICAEGIMLMGALAAVIGSYFTGSAWFGLAMAGLCGVLTAALLGFMVITARAHQTVSGTAINILGLGVSTVVARMLFGTQEGAMQKVNSFQSVNIPVLSDIAVIFDGQIVGITTPDISLQELGLMMTGSAKTGT